MKPLLTTVGMCLVGSAPLAGDYYVDVATGVDAPGGGSALSPWKTITYALSQVAAAPENPDTIHVAAGIYDAASGELFPLAMKPRVRLRGAGQAATIVDGGAAADTVTFHAIPFESFLADSGLERMTVRGGGDAIDIFAGDEPPAVASPLLRDLLVEGALYSGVRVQCAADDIDIKVAPTVERCAIRGCAFGIGIVESEGASQGTTQIRDTTIEQCGEGLRISYDSHPLAHQTYLVERCAILDCGTGIAGTGGGGPFGGVLWLEVVDSVIGRSSIGLDCSANADVFLFRSTVAGCDVGLEGGVYSWIRGSIVWGNAADLGTSAVLGLPAYQEHSDLGWLPGPTGTNVNVDPLFADAAAGAFHLAPGSPVIDLGEPAPVPGFEHHDDSRDPDEDPRRLDGNGDGLARADMGADELNRVRLSASGPLTVGSTLTLTVDGPLGWLRIDAASLGTADVDLGGLGSLLLGPPALVTLGAGTTPGSLALVAPSSAAGIEIFFQSAAIDAGTGVGSTSNRARVVFHE